MQAVMSSDDPLVGTSYRSLSLLGRGAMGLVLDAEHVALGKRVVVKVLHRELASRADLVDRMRLEGQVLARLAHPSLVEVTDFGATVDGRPFVVMERLVGRTLAAELAARGPLPVLEAIGWAREALQGLALAHASGIVHRDVKLENLFLCDATRTEPRRVKVLDFGIAKVREGELGLPPPRFATALGTVVGTPRWLSPEVAARKPFDHRVDLYAMGLVLYALLSGRLPFDHVTGVAELLRAHVELAPPPLSSLARQPIAPAVEAAIHKALAKRPEDRFSSAVAMSDALAVAAELKAPAKKLVVDTEVMSTRLQDAVRQSRALAPKSGPGPAAPGSPHAGSERPPGAGPSAPSASSASLAPTPAVVASGPTPPGGPSIPAWAYTSKRSVGGTFLLDEPQPEAQREAPPGAPASGEAAPRTSAPEATRGEPASSGGATPSPSASVSGARAALTAGATAAAEGPAGREASGARHELVWLALGSAALFTFVVELARRLVP
jgi:serine/threonine protein kinase